MSISVIIISHEEIGTALIQAATKAFHELPLPTTVVNIESHTDPDTLLPKLKQLINNIKTSEGILMLTDLFGATPCNIAKALHQEAKIKMVCGLNLPMIVKVMNYADLNLEELVQKALQGGREGIVEY